MTVAVVGCALAAVGFIGSRAVIGQKDEGEVTSAFMVKDTLYFWYTDEALTDYLNSAALEYYEETGYRIVPALQPGLEYLESINTASLYSEQMPDLYLTTNDTLEKAYLAGLATEVTQEGLFDDTAVFCQTAQDAVTYHDRQVGYPLYFETSILLYNQTYLMDVAKQEVQAEADTIAAEEATQIIENAQEGETEAALAQAEAVEATQYSEEELEEAARQRQSELIPGTIEEILTFSETYDAPENVEAILKWDVSDIFYNYFFVGNYMKAGGDAGDDPAQVDLNNPQAAACMQTYQDLNQFFSIDAKEVTYDSILQEFEEGKIIFTVATTDAISKLETAKSEGIFPYEYGVALLPDISDSLQTRSLSVTSAVVVNGYSEKQEVANDFAVFLTTKKAQELYARTGKISAREGISYENEMIERCMEEYRNSISMPKLLEISNYWVQLEIAFTQVWTGADIAEELDALERQMMQQLEGTAEPYDNLAGTQP